MKRGDIFGEFNLGSTIVLVFEAQRTFRFKVKAGQRTKYGEPIGVIKRTYYDYMYQYMLLYLSFKQDRSTTLIIIPKSL